MCAQCRAFISSSDKVCPYCDAAVGPRAIDVRSPGDILGGLIPHARFATAMFMLINFALFAASVAVSMRSGGEGSAMDIDGVTLFRFGAKYSPAVLAGDWWRLVTAGFLHGGVLHILMNSWALFDLSGQVEELFGASRLVMFYLVSSVGGFVASTFWSNSLSVGASAALFGLIGVMIAFGMKNRTAMGDAIRGMYIRWAMYGLLFGLLPGFRVDNAAHIGGLVTGFVCGYLSGTPRLVTSPTEKMWNIAGWVAVAIIVLSFVKMYLSFSNPLE